MNIYYEIVDLRYQLGPFRKLIFLMSIQYKIIPINTTETHFII